MFLFSTTFLTLPLLFLLLHLLQLHWSIYPSWKRPSLFLTFRTLLETLVCLSRSVCFPTILCDLSVVPEPFVFWWLQPMGIRRRAGSGPHVLSLVPSLWDRCKQGEFLNKRPWSSCEVVIFLLLHCLTLTVLSPSFYY